MKLCKANVKEAMKVKKAIEIIFVKVKAVRKGVWGLADTRQVTIQAMADVIYKALAIKDIIKMVDMVNGNFVEKAFHDY